MIGLNDKQYSLYTALEGCAYDVLEGTITVFVQSS
jgi:hypothetical protein